MNMQTKPPHTAAEKAILDSFAEIMGQLPGDAPVTAARDKLVSAISSDGLPTRRIESWHYPTCATFCAMSRARPAVPRSRSIRWSAAAWCCRWCRARALKFARPKAWN